MRAAINNYVSTRAIKKSQNVLKQKRKKGQAKTLHKKDQYFYNNCFEHRSGAIKNSLLSVDKAEVVFFHK